MGTVRDPHQQAFTMIRIIADLSVLREPLMRRFPAMGCPHWPRGLFTVIYSVKLVCGCWVGRFVKVQRRSYHFCFPCVIREREPFDNSGNNGMIRGPSDNNGSNGIALLPRQPCAV
jgi:hypothetical protein